ncbi:MAG: hypothetical protein Q4D04_14705, partial [Clostridia bacterium]|nr:hypothetical protein [Clostridia bacterium]
MQVIRYNQQSLEDYVRSVMRVETRLDASLSELNGQIDILEQMSNGDSSRVLSAATDELRRLKKLLIRRKEEFLQL